MAITNDGKWPAIAGDAYVSFLSGRQGPLQCARQAKWCPELPLGVSCKRWPVLQIIGRDLGLSGLGCGNLSVIVTLPLSCGLSLVETKQKPRRSGDW